MLVTVYKIKFTLGKHDSLYIWRKMHDKMKDKKQKMEII